MLAGSADILIVMFLCVSSIELWEPSQRENVGEFVQVDVLGLRVPASQPPSRPQMPTSEQCKDCKASGNSTPKDGLFAPLPSRRFVEDLDIEGPVV